MDALRFFSKSCVRIPINRRPRVSAMARGYFKIEDVEASANAGTRLRGPSSNTPGQVHVPSVRILHHTIKRVPQTGDVAGPFLDCARLPEI